MYRHLDWEQAIRGIASREQQAKTPGEHAGGNKREIWQGDKV